MTSQGVQSSLINPYQVPLQDDEIINVCGPVPAVMAPSPFPLVDSSSLKFEELFKETIRWIRNGQFDAAKGIAKQCKTNIVDSGKEMTPFQKAQISFLRVLRKSSKSSLNATKNNLDRYIGTSIDLDILKSCAEQIKVEDLEDDEKLSSIVDRLYKLFSPSVSSSSSSISSSSSSISSLSREQKRKPTPADEDYDSWESDNETSSSSSSSSSARGKKRKSAPVNYVSSDSSENDVEPLASPKTLSSSAQPNYYEKIKRPTTSINSRIHSLRTSLLDLDLKSTEDFFIFDVIFAELDTLRQSPILKQKNGKPRISYFYIRLLQIYIKLWKIKIYQSSTPANIEEIKKISKETEELIQFTKSKKKLLPDSKENARKVKIEFDKLIKINEEISKDPMARFVLDSKPFPYFQHRTKKTDES